MSWEDRLSENVARALRFLGPEPRPWVPPHPGVDHDVLIVGGGQGGVANAFALRRLGVTNVSVIDAAADEEGSGVWLTRARMEVLRTPKTATGPELGIPELSFQSWHAAKHGPDAFERIDLITPQEWASYLRWFRKAAQVEVRYGTRLTRIEPLERHFRVHLEIGGAAKTEIVREIILVTGIEGCGGPNRPAIVTQNLPPSLYSHTADAIDFAALRGKVVAVLGAGTSGLDAAAVAGEGGSAAVHIFNRRAEIPNNGPVGPRGHAGALDNFHLLPDELRWELAVQMVESGAVLPPTALKRLLPLGNVHIHLGAPFETVRAEGGKAVIRAAGRKWRFDHVILGTGYSYDPLLAEPLRDFADKIAVWADRYTPPPDRWDDGLSRHPYLGEGYEFLENVPGEAPFLKHIHLSSKAGSISFGRPVGDIPNLLSGVRGIAPAVARNLFFQDYADHRKAILARGKPLYDRQTYASRLWAGEEEAAV